MRLIHPTTDSSFGSWIRVAVDSIYPTADSSSDGWTRVAADCILRLTQVSVAGYELRLDKSCGWFYPTTYSSSGGWIRVAADSITWLIRVPVSGFRLWLLLQEAWRSLKKLQDSSCDWFKLRRGIWELRPIEYPQNFDPDPLWYRCLKIMIHQIGSKNEWLLLSASFTAKFWVGFCLNTGKRFFLEISC